MSHIEKCSVVITDLKALKAACDNLGCTFVEGQTHFTAYTGQNPCEHAIKVPGTSWEVGLLSADTLGNKIKAWSPAYDPYERGYDPTHKNDGKAITDLLTKGVGKDGKHHFEKLMSQYSLEVLKAKARAKGYQYKESFVGGKLKLTVSLGN